MSKTGNIVVLVFLLVFAAGIYLNLNESKLTADRPDYITNLITENGSLNAVGAVYLDYRFYDTLFEVTVFFVAAFGVVMILKRIPATVSEEHKNNIDYNLNGEAVDFRMKTAGTLIFFLSQVFAIYIILTGHLGPGGGFVGGVVAGTGVLVLSGTRDIEGIERGFLDLGIPVFEKVIMLTLPLYGLIGLFVFDAALSNFHLLEHMGIEDSRLWGIGRGELISGGTALFLNMAIGIKVFAGSWAILYHFVKHRGVV